jgi:hypothetical protein
MLEHDADLSLEGTTSDLKLICVHAHELEAYPQLARLHARAPARLRRMLWQDYGPSMNLMTRVLTGREGLELPSVNTLIARLRQCLEYLLTQANDICEEYVWDICVDALEYAFAECFCRRLKESPQMILTAGLGSVFAENVRSKYGNAELYQRFTDTAAAHALALRICREGLGLCSERVHVHESVHQALTWVLDGEPEVANLYPSFRES